MAYTRKDYTPEERAAYNAQKQAEIEATIKRIDEGVKAVFQSDKYKEYLKFASKFTDYSARNTLLINLQRPDATLVAAYGKWKQLGRQVERGQTGIEILAPVAYKTNQVLETERPAVDEFGNQLYNPDGTEKMETVEKPMTGLAFKKVYVFDVSQTSGKELPDPVTELTGDIDSARKEAVFAALKKVTGIDIEFKDIKGGAKGYYSATNNEIVIKSGMSDAQTLKTAFHEAAHNLLHDPAKDIVTNKSPRNEKEVQAESVAFMVAERFGIDTSEYSFPYIASWSDGKQLEQLKSALQEIQEAAKKISSAIESELLKLQKRNLTMDEKLADTELNNIQKAEFLIEDCADRGVNFSKEDTDKILDFAGNHENISDTVQLVTDMEEIQRQRDSYGYDFTYMTPIDTKEAALEAYDRGEAVYLLYPDNTEGMAESRSEIENFEGYFGIEKEPSPDVVREQNSELIPVSKEIALEMWDKDLDVYVDGVRAESREDIENAPETAKLYLSEFQYTAQLEFEKSQRGNVDRTAEPVSKNPNVIGNTPYDDLGNMNELQYYPKLKTRHALSIAKQLEEDGVKFSGLKKGWTTTITINKADIPRYEAAVAKVKASYSKNNEQPAEPQPKTPADEPTNTKPISNNPNVIGNTPFNELGSKGQLEYFKDLKTRHALNIAKQLEEDGVRFSGLKKGWTTTITINKADVPKYEAAVAKVKASYSKNNEQPAEPQPKTPANEPTNTKPATDNPNVIGNTPYDELGEKGQLEYITKLKTRHALNIAKQLDEDGVKFSGLKKGTVTTITINKADKEKYEAAVAKVKESYSRSKEQTADPLEDKAPVPKPVPKSPEDIAADIDKAISDSNYELYRYNLKQAAATVIEEHGAEKVNRILAEYVVRHDYDGRISANNKEWAKNFDIPENRYPPVFHTHPTVLDGFITEAQVQIKALEKTVEQSELPDVCKDKFLLPVERVELRDDYRGIPETKYYNSSVNEFFVDGIGWLDNAAYDREQKMSGLSAKDFYAKVTQINCSYVDTDGRTGQMDVSRKDYDLLNEKTYSKENSEAYKSAKDKLEQRKQEAGIKPKPVEYYAVRQNPDHKFAVATISADGLVTVAKSGIATIAEAKKALLDIYKSKQSTVRCEFVHPQTLDEKSAEIYRNQTKELPAVTYRITPNPDKKSPDSHILQEYVKNGDDTYAVGKVMAKGDYEKCNSRLANLINPPKIEAPVKTFEIYQLRRVDETRDVRFEPYERLTKAGLKPDFKTYDKMYEADISMLSGKSTGEKLESAFYVFNQERPEDFKGHSLSVSDVVVLDDTAYYVDSVGFKPLNDFIPLEIQQSRFLDTLPQTLQGISDNAAELEAVSDKALKLNIPPEIIREACDMVNGGESLDNMANAYEEKFTEKNAPPEEAPEIEKPKPQKKPKL